MGDCRAIACLMCSSAVIPYAGGFNETGFVSIVSMHRNLPHTASSVANCRVLSVRGDPRIEPSGLGLNTVQRKVRTQGS